MAAISAVSLILGVDSFAVGDIRRPTLATAATVRKRRRVGSRGGNIMGWSVADVFVGGVLCTLSA
jgi:hypothetical protein